MRYRLVPVGDKLVLITEADAAADGDDYNYVRDAKAGCYDFDVEGVSENEGINQVGAWNGGISHE